MKKSSGMLSGMTTNSPPGDSGVRIDKMASKMGAGEIDRTDPAPKVKSIGGRVA
jgi:hypothetical protein